MKPTPCIPCIRAGRRVDGHDPSLPPPADCAARDTLPAVSSDSLKGVQVSDITDVGATWETTNTEDIYFIEKWSVADVQDFLEAIGEEITVAQASWLLEQARRNGMLNYEKIEALYNGYAANNELGEDPDVNADTLNHTVEIRWNAEDLLDVDEELTPQEASYIMYKIGRNYDANHGISTDVIEDYIDTHKDETPADWEI